MMATRISATLVLLVTAGCASGGSSKKTTAAARSDAAEVPVLGVPEFEELITVGAAARLVDQMQADWPTSSNPDLVKPKSLKDLEAILKLDQVNLFPAAIRFAQTQKGGEALAAQIELAWGEAYTVINDVMIRASRRFDIVMMITDPIDLPRGWKKNDLKKLERLSQEMNRIAEAFQMISSEHTSRGLQLAMELIEEKPDNYRGYRIAADYHRTMREWEQFGTMISKVEELKPDSVGLIFLRGAAAFHRDGDNKTAATYYRDALLHDPKFVRAQAHLVLVQQSLADTRKQLKRLAALNPNHQLVLWTQSIIELAYRLEMGG